MFIADAKPTNNNKLLDLYKFNCFFFSFKKKVHMFFFLTLNVVVPQLPFSLRFIPRVEHENGSPYCFFPLVFQFPFFLSYQFINFPSW